MRIITNADDFGQDEETVRATIECFENGSLTSATIMANMPATDAAVEYARRNPQLGFGVHLTYVLGVGNEAPVSDPATLGTLCDASGKFLVSNTTRVAAILGRVSEDEIARETKAQILRLREMGVAISHVDSHGHLHRFAAFRRALSRVLPELGITKVRSSQNLYLRKLYKSPNYWFGPMWRRAIMRTFRTTDNFYMPTSAWDKDWWVPLLDRVPQMEGDSLEVGVHPGSMEAWRREESAGIAAFAAEVRRRGFKLIRWADL